MKAKFPASICAALLSLTGCGGEGEPPDDAVRRAAERRDAEWQAAEQNILGPPLKASPANTGVEGGDNQAKEPTNSADGNGVEDQTRSPST